MLFFPAFSPSNFPNLLLWKPAAALRAPCYSWQLADLTCEPEPCLSPKAFRSQPCSRGAAGRFPALWQCSSCLGASPHALPTDRSPLHGSLVTSVLLLPTRVPSLPLDGWKPDSAGLRALSRAAAVCSPTASPDAPSAPCHPSSGDHLIVGVLKQSCRAR